MAIFSYVHALKGLIHHVVQNFNNYNLSFQKLDIHTVQMRPISACYTSGRGISYIRALFQLRPRHYKWLQSSEEILIHEKTKCVWCCEAESTKHLNQSCP